MIKIERIISTHVTMPDGASFSYSEDEWNIVELIVKLGKNAEVFPKWDCVTLLMLSTDMSADEATAAIEAERGNHKV